MTNKTSLTRPELRRQLSERACATIARRAARVSGLEVRCVSGQRTPDSGSAAAEMRTALTAHGNLIADGALRLAVERRQNPQAHETAMWKRTLLADLTRPRKRQP